MRRKGRWPGASHGARRWAALLLLSVGARAGAAQGATATCRPDGVTTHRSPRGIAYEVIGCGPAVLILHGFSVDRRMWRDLTPTWRTHAQLVLVDLPSHGASATAVAGTDPVDDLLSILRDEQLERVAIIGHSAGAALAVDLAARASGRVSALILLSPSITGFASRTPVDLSAVAQRVRAGDPTGAAEAWLATSVMRTNLAPARSSWFKDLVRDNTRVWQLDGGRAPRPRASVDERLASLRMPVFVGDGALDSAGTHEVSHAIASAQPRARHERFGDAGHWFPVERPEVISALVLDFLLGTWCRPRRASPVTSCPSGPSAGESGRLAESSPHR